MMLKWKISTLLLLLILFVGGYGYVHADNDEREWRGHHEESGAEEMGKLIGWGTVGFAGVAGLLFPLRRFAKNVNQNMPAIRETYKKGLKQLSRFHPLLGLIALAFGIIHGVLMYLDEGEIEGRGWIGILSIVLVMIASFFGYSLMKKKKSFKRDRKVHMALMITAGVLTLVHVIAS